MSSQEEEDNYDIDENDDCYDDGDDDCYDDEGDEEEEQKIQKKKVKSQFYDWKGIYENVLKPVVKHEIQDLLQIDFDKSLIIFQHYGYNLSALTSNIFNEMEEVNEKYGLKYECKEQQLKQLENQECPSCFGDEGMCSKLPCGHIFCDECIESYLKLKVSENFLFFSCLEEGCNYCIRHSIFEAFLDMELFGKKLISNYCEKSKEIIQCPGTDCIYMLYNNIDDQVKYVNCDCGKGFCSKCIQEIHQPAPCEMLVSWKKATDQDDLNLQWIASNTKQCPYCKRAIERSFGCNYMHCAPPGGCNNAFCYVCEAPVDPAQHGHSNCPGEKKGGTGEDLLRKINFFFDKYKICEVVQQKAQKYLDEKVEGIRFQLFENFEIPLQNSQFIADSLKVLILSRDALKYSYAFSYHFKYEQKKTIELFQFYQREYEKQTEGLAMCFEMKLLGFVNNLTKFVQDKKQNKKCKFNYEELQEQYSEMRKSMLVLTDSVTNSKEKMIEAVELGTIYID